MSKGKDRPYSQTKYICAHCSVTSPYFKKKKKIKGQLSAKFRHAILCPVIHALPKPQNFKSL